MTQKVLLDTSAFSHFRAGNDEVATFISEADVVYVCATMLGELLAGFRLGTRERANRVLLDEFLAEPFVRFAPVTAQTCEHYARIFAELRQAGTPIPINDIWIAASSFEHDARLLTFDSDFARVRSLSMVQLLSP